MTKSDALKALLVAILVAPHLELDGNLHGNALAAEERFKRNKKKLGEADRLMKELV
jgi:hypothetical protein